MSDTAADELLLFVSPTPLLMCDVRLRLDPCPIATDASEQGGGSMIGSSLTATGVADAKLLRPTPGDTYDLDMRSLQCRLMFGLLRRADHRGSDVSLDLGVPFVHRPATVCSVDPSRWHWQLATCYPWEREAHINELEMRALLNAIKWKLRKTGSCRLRTCFFVDSRVTIGVVTKCRSSSRRLNRIVRRISALCHAAGLAPFFVYIASALNPADAPSRIWRRG